MLRHVLCLAARAVATTSLTASRHRTSTCFPHMRTNPFIMHALPGSTAAAGASPELRRSPRLKRGRDLQQAADAVVPTAAQPVNAPVEGAQQQQTPRKRGRAGKQAASSAPEADAAAAAVAAEVATEVVAGEGIAAPAAEVLEEQGSPGATTTPVGKKAAKKLKAAMEPSVDITPQLLAKALEIANQLQELYPNPPIPLDHTTPFQLLVAVMLSAQSTDIKVNEVTPALFTRAPDAPSMALLDVKEVEGYIKVLGLAPTKAKNLVGMSQMLMEHHGGQVPDTFEQLEALPGVGHKTASVVMSQVFNKAAFPVDTHIHRLAQRWGLTRGHTVEQTEADLKVLFPEDSWRDLHLQIIYFGREHCPAMRHEPSECLICSRHAVPPYDRAGSSPPRPGKKPVAASQRGKKARSDDD